MAERDLTYEDILRIVELIKSASHFSEFRLKAGDIEVSLRRADRTSSAPAAVQRNFEPAAAEDPVRQTPSRTFSDAAHLVRSPMVGTFYRAPAPSKPPFVEVGQSVEPDSVVCIIEVMKLMNSIEAGTRGVVREILVSNGAGVEYGEVLMVIEPGKP